MKLKQGYIDDSGTGHIPLTQGKETLVNAHWFHILSQFNWLARHDPSSGHWYALRWVRQSNGKRTAQYMARVIMGATDAKIQIDHKDCNATLDNREENLRVATNAQNSSNKGLKAKNTSGYKGVYKHASKWQSQIGFNRKRIYLGQYDTREAAAQAYNEAALLYHKEFAVLNPLPPEQLSAAA